MNVEQLKQELENLGVPKLIYSLSGRKDERLCIENRNGIWYVFFVERGQEREYAAKYYQKFLFLSQRTDYEYSNVTTTLTLSDPLTAEELFAAKTTVNTAWVPSTDQNTSYPLLNSLIGYVKEHSATYNNASMKQ